MVFNFPWGGDPLSPSVEAVFSTQRNDFIPKELGHEINIKVLNRSKTNTLPEICPTQIIPVIKPEFQLGILLLPIRTWLNKPYPAQSTFSMITNLFGHLDSD
jgi:hypothetical protein